LSIQNTIRKNIDKSKKVYYSQTTLMVPELTDFSFIPYRRSFEESGLDRNHDLGIGISDGTWDSLFYSFSLDMGI